MQRQHYLLICGLDKSEHQILRAGKTTGNPKTMSSLRPEHTGALASILLTAILSHKYHLPPSSGYLNLGIDNITVVKRLQQDRYDKLGDDNHDVTDYDLWHESMNIIHHQSATITTMHIKGHQDDVLKDDFGGVGPLPRHSHYNVVADKQAEKQRIKINRQCQEIVPPPSTKAALFIKGKYIPSDTAETIVANITTPPLTDYLQRRNHWDDDVFHSIDWDAHEYYIRKLPYLKAIKVIKYIHDWQNTGVQKARFDAQRETPEFHPSEYLCPMKCGCQETQQHFLRCPIINSNQESKRVLASLRKWLQQAATHPVVTTALMHCITQWLVHGNDDTSQLNITQEASSNKIQTAILAQSRIGWDHLFKGRLAKQWGDIQHDYYSNIRKSSSHNLKKYHDREWWTSTFIKQIVYIALNAWQMRNDRLHQNKETSAYQTTRNSLLAEVKEWYDKEGQFDDLSHKRHFSKTYLDRKNSTNAQLQLWTRAVSSTYNYMTRQPHFKPQAPILSFVHRDDPSQN